MPKPSLRGLEAPASPIRKLAPLANEARRRGVKVISLNIGQPDLPTPKEGLEVLHHVDRKVLEYSPSDGIPSLRDKMAEYYDRFNMNVKPEDIIVTTGGSEAVMLAFMSTLNPGDEVIIPEPAYANYITFAKMAGAVIRPVVARIDNGFALPPIEDFEKLITDRTRAILICNPNNPTGYVYTRQELEALRDIVKRHDLYLFSDEVYREFCYTDEPYFSAMHLEGVEDNVVIVDSVSKRYNECGIRIGALVTKNKELKSIVMKFCQARLSPPLLGQLVAQASIDAPQEYLDGVYDEYINRRNVLVEGLNSIPGVVCPMPKGAFYCVVGLPVENAEDFCKWCLNEFSYKDHTIFMAPAAGFYTTPGAGTNEVRIAYVLEIDELKLGVEVLRAALEAYNAR